MPSFTIKSYSVKTTNCAIPYAWIMLFDKDNKFQARLDFYPVEESNTYTLTQDGDFIHVDLNYKTFSSLVDLLRHERPMTFNWFITTQVCIISTGEEPVGEDEP